MKFKINIFLKLNNFDDLKITHNNIINKDEWNKNNFGNYFKNKNQINEIKNVDLTIYRILDDILNEMIINNNSQINSNKSIENQKL